MRFIDVRTTLDELFAEELASFGSLQHIQFMQRNHADIYRLRAERGTLIAHASPDGKWYLQRVRTNLEFLERLEDSRIPRVVAWRSGRGHLPGHDWAVLLYEEIPGTSLSPTNFSRSTCDAVMECLAQLHGLDGDRQASSGPRPDANAASEFASFARTLQLRMADLPLDTRRVGAHLDELGEFISSHQGAFDVPQRLIHGDLDRKNIVVSGNGVGILDWADLQRGDYAFDLAMLKFMLDSVAPRLSTELVRGQARRYRRRFDDGTLELRLRFYGALAGLVHAFQACDDTGAFKPARAWRVRTSYLHSEAQWRAPMKLDGDAAGAPAVRTEQWALDIDQPFRGLFYLLAPKRLG